MWQEIIVGLCVLGALIFLARRWLPGSKKKATGCGSGCGGCSSTNTCATPETSAKAADNPKP